MPEIDTEPKITYPNTEDVDETITKESVFAKMKKIRVHNSNLQLDVGKIVGAIVFLSDIANCNIYDRTFS